MLLIVNIEILRKQWDKMWNKDKDDVKNVESRWLGKIIC